MDIDGYSVPAGTTTFNYIDVFTNAAFGTVAVTDANAVRPAGSSWNPPTSVTALAAPAAGRVLSAYGTRIVVSHGIVKGVGLATTYNHLSRILVPSGPVARGQLIAYSGTTGHSTGGHLHFETVEDGVRVNPLAWI